jgi:hypothetical protein
MFVLSHMGNATKQVSPTTSMAITLGLAHAAFAFLAIVNGNKINAKAALNNNVPPTSSSFHKPLTTPSPLNPLKTLSLLNRFFATILPFYHIVTANGKT